MVTVCKCVASTQLPPAFTPTPRRYHYNVANTRVDQHVEKGNDDGLYISSVACCQELWALIMDAGTGFTAQTYSLSNQFLPKEWIMVSLHSVWPCMFWYELSWVPFSAVGWLEALSGRT